MISVAQAGRSRRRSSAEDAADEDPDATGGGMRTVSFLNRHMLTCFQGHVEPC